ncbi:MAG: glycine reductase, partial [Spirochaetota bacterium]
MADSIPVITACSYNLFHCPFFSMEYGTTPAAERAANPASDYLKALPRSLRSFDQVVRYPPNQVYIGNLSPKALPPLPWFKEAAPAPSSGKFGSILDEKTLYALMKFADAFNLVVLEQSFVREAGELLEQDVAFTGVDLSKVKAGIEPGAVE